jgi:hypothetical protein
LLRESYYERSINAYYSIISRSTWFSSLSDAGDLHVGSNWHYNSDYCMGDYSLNWMYSFGKISQDDKGHIR